MSLSSDQSLAAPPPEIDSRRPGGQKMKRTGKRLSQPVRSLIPGSGVQSCGRSRHCSGVTSASRFEVRPQRPSCCRERWEKVAQIVCHGRPVCRGTESESICGPRGTGVRSESEVRRFYPSTPMGPVAQSTGLSSLTGGEGLGHLPDSPSTIKHSRPCATATSISNVMLTAAATACGYLVL